MEIRSICVVLCILFGLCEGIQNSTCTHSIPHGKITWWCGVGDSCPYSCNEGYLDHEKVSWVRCNSAGKWEDDWYSSGVTEDELCTPKSCPSTIPNGQLASNCSATVDTSCGYVCNSGYQSKVGVATIRCQTSTNWSVDPHTLCSNDTQCPYDLAHGDLDLSCTRNPGETCNYACHIGYLPSNRTAPTTVTCDDSLPQWSHPLSTLCQKVQCPVRIPHGYISSSCSREVKSYCYDYGCDTGYQKPSTKPSLSCDASGEWSWETYNVKTLCSKEEDLCPASIKNGHIIWHCSRQAGATCTYDCRAGCNESSTTWLRCQDDATWNVNTDTLCECDVVSTTSTTSAPRTTDFLSCSFNIPHGRMAGGCDLVAGYVCGYTCDSGCSPTFRGLRCHVNGSWESEDTACDCQGPTIFSPTTFSPTTFSPMHCSPFIINGRISRQCSLASQSYCDFICDVGCTRTRDYLYCDDDGLWMIEAGACECRGGGEGGSNLNLGVIVGSVVGASLLVIIMVLVVCWKYKRHQTQAPPTIQTAQGSLRQPVAYHKSTNQNADTGVPLGAIPPSNPAYTLNNTPQRTGVDNPYHYYIDVFDSQDMQTGGSNPVAGAPSPQQRLSGQYASLQGNYNDYLTPYSSLQPTTRTEPVNTGATDEYARIGDISSETPDDGYITPKDNRPLPKTPNSAYESQDRPQDPPPTYEESQTTAAIQKSLKEL